MYATPLFYTPYDELHRDAESTAIRNRVPYTRIFTLGRPVTRYWYRLPLDIRQWTKRQRKAVGKFRPILRH